MITMCKLKIYTNFKGDGDSWLRFGSKREKALINDEDWFLIDGLMQDIQLVKKGLTSKEYSLSVHNRLIENCDNLETIELLKTLPDKLNREF